MSEIKRYRAIVTYLRRSDGTSVNQAGFREDPSGGIVMWDDHVADNKRMDELEAENKRLQQRIRTEAVLLEERHWIAEWGTNPLPGAAQSLRAVLQEKETGE